MGNNATRSTQWSEEPVKDEGPKCGSVSPRWPFKVCKLRPGHDGEHCNKVLAGTKTVELWWVR